MVRMTSYAAGGGCACKVPIGELETLLAGVDLPGHPDLLVGADTGDDAAVLRIDGGRAVISTVDFFTPVVDDPYDWGRVVAANAMSDVWAMGGEPVLAVNLVGWPRARLDAALLTDVLRGGAGADALTDWVATSLDIEGPADRDRLLGGRGDDFIGVTHGSDVVRAGEDDDVIKLADDDAVDDIDCGGGDDRLLYYSPVVDPLDVVVGCEHVRALG